MNQARYYAWKIVEVCNNRHDPGCIESALSLVVEDLRRSGHSDSDVSRIINEIVDILVNEYGVLRR